MSKRTYHPDRGDIVTMNFMPAAGREIDKRRPAIVLSPLAYNTKSGLCLAVPITSDLSPGPMWIRLPDGLLDRPGLVLCDYVRSMDYRERSIVFVKTASLELIDQITLRVMELVDPVLK